ncbi:hypothetical protein BIY37_00285, partial [Candidatus Brocadia sapporoensis]
FIYGFTVASYDKRYPLVIDPTLVYSTYLGGSDDDSGLSSRFGGTDIAVDGDGNAYVTGSTKSLDFPTKIAVYGTYTGKYDAFVTKIGTSGTSLLYSTYLGGSEDDYGLRIAVDNAGNAYVTGWTQSSDFPTANAMYGTNTGWTDAFVTKIAASGTSLSYSTYLGGSNFDWGSGIAVDGAGNAYVTGSTYSSNFPTKTPIYVSNKGDEDVFVTKIGTSGTSLSYSTYLGGNARDESRGMAVDSAGNVYVTGFTWSSDFPTEIPIYGTYTGSYDAFVTKIGTSGTSLSYSTYLGGNARDESRGMAVDSAGNVYVTGFTWSSDFPTEIPIYGTYTGSYDAFVTKIGTSGTSLSYSTYLGGSDADEGYSIAVDSAGNAYVTGYTKSSDFPTEMPIYGTYTGTSDAFVTKIAASGTSLSYSTFLGGIGDEAGESIAVDSAGNAYVTGYTGSSNFPTEKPIYGTNTGSWDAFVTKISTLGTSLSYSTYLGGSYSDHGTGIAVDSVGNAYVKGETYSSDFPTIINAFDESYNGSSDVFVTKIGDSTPTVVELVSFSANGNTDGKVTLHWQTATEIDNAGFNLYRAKRKDGPYKKINTTLIPAQGNATTGASYSYEDTPPAKGAYHYKLEDVDTNSVSTMHGPKKVKVKIKNR